MSRVPAPPPSAPLAERMWPLEGERATIMNAVVSAFAVARAALPNPVARPIDVDLLAADTPDTAELVALARNLLELLVHEVAMGRAQPLVPPDASPALGALRAASGGEPVHVSRAHREMALLDAGGIIREIGLEYYDLDCLLGIEPNGAYVIASAPVSKATAHVWLLDRLYQRAEAFALTDEVLAYERMASAWYFAQWSVAGRGKLSDGMRFTQALREEEWSFVERETVTFDVPIMVAFADDEQFSAVPPRQQHLARALLASIVDIFVVEAVGDDGSMTLRPARGGRAHRVHEHNVEARVHPGYLVIGRLIPFEDGVWLRSPGTVMFSPRFADDAAVLADALRRTAATMPLPIALEALISTVVLDGRPPLAPKPATSAAAARTIVEFMTSALDDLGLREAAPLDEVPNEIAARLPLAGEGVEYYRYAIDAALAEWLGALSAQAGVGRPSGPSSGAGGSKRQKRRKGKKKRRR